MTPTRTLVGLILLAAMACSPQRAPAPTEQAPPPNATPTPRPPTPRALLPSPVLVEPRAPSTVIANDREPPAPAFTPTGRNVGEIVFVARGELVRFDVGHGTRTVLSSDASGWCVADPLTDAVWFVRERNGHKALWVTDLRQGGTSHEVVAEVPEAIDSIVIRRGDAAVGDEAINYEVAIEVAVGDASTCRGRIGCEGSASYDCHDWSRPNTGGDDAPYRNDITERVASLATCKTRSRRFLRQLATRATETTLQARPPQLTHAVAIDWPKRDCLSAQDCGAAFAITGTDWQLVISGEDAEDFFHQSLLLYHPARKVFRIPASTGADITLGDQLPEGRELNDAHISPTASAYYVHPGIYTFDGELLWHDDYARFCGWVGGSGRIGHLKTE